MALLHDVPDVAERRLMGGRRRRRDGMSRDTQKSNADVKSGPGAVRVLALGDAAGIPAVVETLNRFVAGEGLSWSTFVNPDAEFAALVRTGSQADIAVAGVEAGATALRQIERWVWLASELGVPHLVVLAESADLPTNDRADFDAVMTPVLDFVTDRCVFQSVDAVPITIAANGNIIARDASVDWYTGLPLNKLISERARQSSRKPRSDQSAESVQSDHFQARLFWLQDDALLPWRPLQLHSTCGQRDATITSIKYELDPHATERIARSRLKRGEVGVCNVNTTKSFNCVPFAQDRHAGRFTLVDPETENIAALGLIDYSLHRASNIRWQETTITPAERARAKKQKASVLWFTGLSGAGKSTIADRVEKRLTAAGRHTMLLDGDNVRHGLNKDLGFTDVDRVENIRRISEVSKLMCDAGLIVLVSFISPFRAERQLARETVKAHNFYEIFVATPLEVAESRDVKGLYAKARAGEIKNFTGIDSPYEPPLHPDLTVDTTTETPDQAAERIVTELLLKT